MPTLEDIRRRHPKLTEAQAKRVIEYLGTPAASIDRVWAGEDQMGDETPAIDADGLTPAMVALNEYADENALPIPFPVS